MANPTNQTMVPVEVKLYGTPDSHGVRSNNTWREIVITSISEMKIS